MDLATVITQSTKETITVTKSTINEWYEMSKEVLNPLIKQQTQTLHTVRSDSSINVERTKKMCIDARKNVSEATMLCKLQRDDTRSKYK